MRRGETGLLLPPIRTGELKNPPIKKKSAFRNRKNHKKIEDRKKRRKKYLRGWINQRKLHDQEDHKNQSTRSAGALRKGKKKSIH